LSLCCKLASLALLTVLAATAQFRGFQAASVVPPAPVAVKAGAEIKVPVVVRIRPGYHINSNKPAEDYLIPTQIAWDAAPFEVIRVEYPEAEVVSYDFSEKPLSVYSGEIEIVTVLKAPAKAAPGDTLVGRLHYQACNNKACLAPASTEISAPLTSE
jgi:DsbC/DsbD-like thiol-disulfide interchange protein